jgi:hypothetical protein
MNSLAIPLRLKKGGLARNENVKKSIDSAMSLLLTTPCFSSAADPGYGFIFNNLRFEIVNENEGVVYNSSRREGSLEAMARLYGKKISGTSTNMNTFASELKSTIETYEPRLQDVSVSMTYIREERKIYITVKAVIAETSGKYQYTTVINVWK